MSAEDPRSDRELLLMTSAHIAQMAEQITRIEKAVFGNGRPGLVSRMDIIETGCAARKAQARPIDWGSVAKVATITTTAIGGIVAAVLQLL